MRETCFVDSALWALSCPFHLYMCRCRLCLCIWGRNVSSCVCMQTVFNLRFPYPSCWALRNKQFHSTQFRPFLYATDSKQTWAFLHDLVNNSHSHNPSPFFLVTFLVIATFSHNLQFDNFLFYGIKKDLYNPLPPVAITCKMPLSCSLSAHIYYLPYKFVFNFMESCCQFKILFIVVFPSLKMWYG